MNSTPKPVATRKSPLALAQARTVQQHLADVWNIAEPETAFPLVGLTTSGDRITDRALLEAGGKGLFTKELERALLDGEARFAVHSMKDVPTRLPDGLEIACVLEREDPRDVLLAADGIHGLDDLPEGARIGTASIRRQAQALNRRADLKPVLLRGNVDTRLEKLARGEVDATFLARAGLRRLGRSEADRPALDPGEMLPAAAQGAVGVEIRSDDDEARALLAPLNHIETAVCVAAERAFLAALDGSCRTPIAAYAVLDGANLFLRGEALTPDGSHKWAESVRIDLPECDTGAAAVVGQRVGEQVRAAGGEALARAIARSGES